MDEASMAGISEKTAPRAAKALAKSRALPREAAPQVGWKSAPGATAAAAAQPPGLGLESGLDPVPGKRIKVKLAPDQRPLITYARHQGVDAFVSRFASATPMEIVEVERQGVDSMFLKDLSKRMDIPAVRMFDIVGIPKATAEKKVAAKEAIAGASGQAALGLARLLAMAKSMVENSTAAEAKDFDEARWLGQWIERPQPALGGRKPADLISTPTGMEMVAKVLGAIESGAYQ